MFIVVVDLAVPVLFKDYWKKTGPVLYYENSNIWPKEENDLRYENLKKVADHYDLNLIRGNYDHESWLSFIQGLEDEPEHGKNVQSVLSTTFQEPAKWQR